MFEGWTLTSTPPGAWGKADDIPAEGVDWIPATVPGTVAGALRDAGRWSIDAPTPLHDRDHWYRSRLTETGPRRLLFDGLATIAEVYLDGQLLLTSRSMFAAHALDIAARAGAELVIAFRALKPHLDTLKPKRARWRTSLIPEQRLRAVRTTLLGHMPGWCPPIDTIGPWREIRVIDPADIWRHSTRIRTELDGSIGRLVVELDPPPGIDPADARLSCAGHTGPFVADADGRLRADLTLPDVAPWWPHTHGEPRLHDVKAEIGGAIHHLGRAGFRQIELDRGSDGKGFGLRINGVDIFTRGVVWTPADFVTLAGDRGTSAPELTRIRDAGLNMVRVSGICTYETAAFHALCDELGLLVWQDLMFANFDYPAADPAFVASVSAEVAGLLDRLSASPSLAIVCGGSEITQQAAMMGLPPASWGNALFDDIFPALVERLRPGCLWVRSTPDGGAMPFAADTGVTHYYGVGAYRRPLDDARRAHVRFAAECLAFAHVPEPATLEQHLAVPPVHDPRWKARVPRDNAAAWDFEDTRQHYEADIFRADANALRQEDPQRYLDIARATTAHVIEATMAEWRRPGSVTRGALVFTYKDPLVGPGWGFVDVLGVPKSSWHALARASRPLALLLSDEGVNGLDVHIVNDGPALVAARLDLVSLADGHRPVVSGTRDVVVEAHASLSLAATTLFGGFFDTTRAYRFGPAAHDLTHARLVAADGTLLAEAFHLPSGRSLERRPSGLAVRVERRGAHFDLVVSCTVAALSVAIDDAHFLPDDNGFHLAPGERRIELTQRIDAPAEVVPQGHVRALNALDKATYRFIEA